MKVSEAIDQLEIGDTVWAKATLDMINDKGRYVRVMPNASSVYLDGHDEISLAEPQADKVEVTEEQAELLRAFKGESIYELLTNCLVEDEELMAKARLFGYTVKPKRWVVKNEEGRYFVAFSKYAKTPFEGVFSASVTNLVTFDDQSKAEAVAVLVEGSVEEV